MYKISKFTGIDRKTIRRHIIKLVENNLVSKKDYGTLVLYSLNEDNPRLNVLITFFKKSGL
jgi:DNA-binding transcriptional ArsR family regulator